MLALRKTESPEDALLAHRRVVIGVNQLSRLAVKIHLSDAVFPVKAAEPFDAGAGESEGHGRTRLRSEPRALLNVFGGKRLRPGTGVVQEGRG